MKSRENPISALQRMTGLCWIAVASAAAMLAVPAAAHADTATFDVQNLAFSVTTINGNPATGVYYGNARFTWTYAAGDFGGGSGTLDSFYSPFVPYPSYAKIITADLTGIAISLLQNLDNVSYDIQVNFASGLTGPGSATTVTGGNFDVSNIYGGEWVGTFTGGSVTSAVPEINSGYMMLAGLGLVGFVARARRKSPLPLL